MMVRGAGTHLISWAQTRVDGTLPDARERITEGAQWRWFGAPVRVDGPQAAFLLGNGIGLDDLHMRAARVVRKLFRTHGTPTHPEIDADIQLFDDTLIVTDGARFWPILPVAGQDPAGPLLLFAGGIPPANKPLTVVQAPEQMCRPAVVDPRGVICFTPGTRIQTDQGATLVEDLFPGDRVQTKDNGPQEILWMGMRKVSGARMAAHPHLRPIRIRAGALGGDQPQPDLVVSPEHRVLLSGRRATALFNTPEVLVRAGDLVDDRKVLLDHSAIEAVYIHILLQNHQVIFANGVETESFHPASAELDHLNSAELEELLEFCPGVDADPLAYGEHARRCLDRAELALLQYDTPPRHLN